MSRASGTIRPAHLTSRTRHVDRRASRYPRSDGARRPARRAPSLRGYRDARRSTWRVRLVRWAGRMVPLARDMQEFGDVTADLSIPRIFYWIPVLLGVGASALATLAFIARWRR